MGSGIEAVGRPAGWALGIVHGDAVLVLPVIRVLVGGFDEEVILLPCLDDAFGPGLLDAEEARQRRHHASLHLAAGPEAVEPPLAWPSRDYIQGVVQAIAVEIVSED